MFTRYIFKKKLTTNLTEDLKSQKIDFKNDSEYLKYVVEILNDEAKSGLGYNKGQVESNYYMVDITFETDGSDIYACFDIYESYNSKGEIVDAREADKWLRMAEKAGFEQFFDTFVMQAFGYLTGNVYYPLCTGWSFEGTKFVDINGNDVSMRFKEGMHTQPFTITKQVYFADLIP